MHQRAEFISIISLWFYYHLSTPFYTSSYNGSYYSPYSQHSAIFFRGRYPAAGLFQIPWASTNPWTTMHLTLTNHPPCWCSQTILATGTCLPTSLFQQRQIYSFPFLSSDTSGTDENNIHLDDLRHSRPSVTFTFIYSFKLSLSSSPQPIFDPSPTLSLNFGNMTVHTPNSNTAPLPQISTRKVLCLSINLDPFLDSLCQMTSSNRILVFPLSTLPMVMMTWWTVPNSASCLPPSLVEVTPIELVFFFNLYLPSVKVNYIVSSSDRRLSAFSLGSESNDQLSQQRQRGPSPSRFPRKKKKMLMC